MTGRRIDQGMATAAAAILPAEVTSELRTRLKQLPSMLRLSGLAATYAYIASRAKGDKDSAELATAYRNTALALRKRLRERNLLTGDPEKMDPRDVLRQLGKLRVTDYARASTEAAALAGWLSRLADALQKPKETGAGTK